MMATTKYPWLPAANTGFQIYLSQMARPRSFPDHALVERNPKLDIDALYRAGALHAGEISRWACHWLMVTIRAEEGWIWIDDQRVPIARDEILNGRYGRTKFLCPGCNRGCRILHARATKSSTADRWVCRDCAEYDYSSRHKNRWAPGLTHLASLRRRIELGHPLHGWSKRRLRRATLALERDVADSVHDFMRRQRWP